MTLPELTNTPAFQGRKVNFHSIVREHAGTKFDAAFAWIPEVESDDDSDGVTAAFNMNLVTRINRELSGTIPADALDHRAVWNDDLARVEMHLVANRDIDFTVSGESFSMRSGETIHTENSHKFTPRSANLLLLAGGWTPIKRWVDEDERFSVVLARATEQREAP